VDSWGCRTSRRQNCLTPCPEPGTEIVEMPNRGHALTIDNGWREVCDIALACIKRFIQ
jgi:hypothetical protein